MFCYACGKHIHETAKSCPQCGAMQAGVASKEPSHWSSITSFITGIISLLILLTEPHGKWDENAVLGGTILGAVPVAFAIYSLPRVSKDNRSMAIAGLCLGVFVALVTLGSM